MKICISNLAWEPVLDTQVAQLLQKYEIRGIDLVPTKLWSNPVSTSKDDIQKYRQFWSSKGIKVVAIQSLLFGHPEMNLFEDQKSREATMEYLRKFIYVSYLLGARALIFGSPKNRRVGALSKSEIDNIALPFFSKVSDLCRSFDLTFCLEPNPVQYGCDFITTHHEAIELAKKINNPGFKINLDTSTMTLNRENYQKTITEALPWSGHVHISEPNLVAVPSGLTHHTEVASILKGLNYRGWTSIEMLTQPETSFIHVKKAITYVKNTYS